MPQHTIHIYYQTTNIINSLHVYPISIQQQQTAATAKRQVYCLAFVALPEVAGGPEKITNRARES